MPSLFTFYSIVSRSVFLFSLFFLHFPSSFFLCRYEGASANLMMMIIVWWWRQKFFFLNYRLYHYFYFYFHFHFNFHIYTYRLNEYIWWPMFNQVKWIVMVKIFFLFCWMDQIWIWIRCVMLCDVIGYDTIRYDPIFFYL